MDCSKIINNEPIRLYTTFVPTKENSFKIESISGSCLPIDEIQNKVTSLFINQENPRFELGLNRHLWNEIPRNNPNHSIPKLL